MPRSAAVASPERPPTTRRRACPWARTPEPLPRPEASDQGHQSSPLPVRRRGRHRAACAAGLAALVGLGALTACSPAAPVAPTTSTSTPAAPPTPAAPIAAAALPMSTDLRPANIEDPSTARVVGLLLRGLVRYDAKGKAVNEVAQSIETTDNTVYTVRLQPEWTFGDGEPLTASSFADAWNYAARSQSGQFHARDFAAILGYDSVRGVAGRPPSADTLAGVEVLDPLTLRITLTQPEPDFPATLGQLSFAPLPKAALSDPAAWSRQPIGNGPYRLEGAWPQSPAGGAVVRLRPNPSYRGSQPPQNAGVDLRVYDAVQKAYDDLRAGTLDVLDQVPVAELPRYRTEFGSRAVNQPIGVAQSIVFPVTRDPWRGESGLALRQAISTSIDRAALASGLLADTALPATDLSAPVVEGYSTEACGQWCSRDQSLSAAAAQRAGQFAGPLTLAYAQDGDDGPIATEVCREVTQALGWSCQPKGYPTLLALREAVALGAETGPYLETWTMTRPTLSAFLVPRFTTGSPSNGSGFADDLVDTRFTAAANAPVSGQAAAYAAVEPLIFAELPVVPLWSRNAVGVTGKTVTAARVDVFGSPIYPEIVRP